MGESLRRQHPNDVNERTSSIDTGHGSLRFARVLRVWEVGPHHKGLSGTYGGTYQTTREVMANLHHQIIFPIGSRSTPIRPTQTQLQQSPMIAQFYANDELSEYDPYLYPIEMSH